MKRICLGAEGVGRSSPIVLLSIVISYLEIHLSGACLHSPIQSSVASTGWICMFCSAQFHSLVEEQTSARVILIWLFKWWNTVELGIPGEEKDI